jgi:hypothetical protein
MRTASKDRKKDYIKRNYFTSILIYIVPVSKRRKKGARTVWILWNELNEGVMGWFVCLNVLFVFECDVVG